eukprot:jgi/Mesen1/8675/ME000051S08084
MCAKGEEEWEMMSQVPMRKVAGSIMYLMVCTRPNIANVVGVVSQFMEYPSPAHWEAMKRILRYLKGTPNLWLHLGGAESDVYTRLSTTACAFSLAKSVVTWKRKRQMMVALSSTEAEYKAAS